MIRDLLPTTVKLKLYGCSGTDAKMYAYGKADLYMYGPGRCTRTAKFYRSKFPASKMYAYEKGLEMYAYLQTPQLQVLKCSGRRQQLRTPEDYLNT